MQRTPAWIASLTGIASHSRISAFCRRIAFGPAATIESTHLATAASSSAAGTTRSTRPHSRASRASMFSPV